MKILLDECVDRRLARRLTSHDVKTARQMGWSAIRNGELLSLASKHFDLFVTVDRSIPFQQNLLELLINVVVLHAKTNRLVDLEPLVPKLLLALSTPRRRSSYYRRVARDGRNATTIKASLEHPVGDASSSL